MLCCCYSLCYDKLLLLHRTAISYEQDVRISFSLDCNCDSVMCDVVLIGASFVWTWTMANVCPTHVIIA